MLSTISALLLLLLFDKHLNKQRKRAMEKRGFIPKPIPLSLSSFGASHMVPFPTIFLRAAGQAVLDLDNKHVFSY